MSTCLHLGDELRQESCPSCRGEVRVKVYECGLLGAECTLSKELGGLMRCSTCAHKVTSWKHAKQVHGRNRWLVGVTTVAERLHTTLPRTLDQLQSAGFPRPVLFIDGSYRPRMEYPLGTRASRLGVYGNWVLGLAELYFIDPKATHYAMFQDDISICRNVRQYLDKLTYPDKGYWNLYLTPENEKDQRGFYASNQKGRGALSLVFDNQTVRTLLTRPTLIDWPFIAAPHKNRKNLDGGISNALRGAGIREFVHSPTLVRHAGNGLSTVGHEAFEQSATWRGSDFDALELLERSDETTDEPQLRNEVPAAVS